MENLGHEGLNKMLDGFDDRSAEAVCTFAFCRGPGEEPLIFQGRTAVCFYLFTEGLVRLDLMRCSRVLSCGREARRTLVCINQSNQDLLVYVL